MKDKQFVITEDLEIYDTLDSWHDCMIVDDDNYLIEYLNDGEDGVSNYGKVIFAADTKKECEDFITFFSEWKEKLCYEIQEDPMSSISDEAATKLSENKEVLEKIKEELTKVSKEYVADPNFGIDIKDYKKFRGIDAKELLKRWQNLLDKNNEPDEEDYEWTELYGFDPFVARRTNRNNPHKFDLLAKDGTVYSGCYPIKCSTVDSNAEDNGSVITVNFDLSTENTVEDFDITVELSEVE